MWLREYSFACQSVILLLKQNAFILILLDITSIILLDKKLFIGYDTDSKIQVLFNDVKIMRRYLIIKLISMLRI